MDDFATVWELVIRSGNVDLLRTTHGHVDRNLICAHACQCFTTRQHSLLASFIHSAAVREQAKLTRKPTWSASSFQWAQQSKVFSMVNVSPVYALAVPIAPLGSGSGIPVFPAGFLG